MQQDAPIGNVAEIGHTEDSTLPTPNAKGSQRKNKRIRKQWIKTTMTTEGQSEVTPSSVGEDSKAPQPRKAKKENKKKKVASPSENGEVATKKKKRNKNTKQNGEAVPFLPVYKKIIANSTAENVSEITLTTEPNGHMVPEVSTGNQFEESTPKPKLAQPKKPARQKKAKQSFTPRQVLAPTTGVSPPSIQEHKPMKQLPILDYQSSIIESIEENRVVVVTGYTGCGKSTQIPKIILKHHIENSDKSSLSHVKIICTQPRRLAATSLSKRVNSEMKKYLSHSGKSEMFGGKIAGYMIGGETDFSSKTPIVFATEGCLTQIIMHLHSKNVSGTTYENFHKHYSYIILDEIHERKVDTDLLLHFVREIVMVNPYIRVILMSATISQDKICKYFEDALRRSNELTTNNEELGLVTSEDFIKVPCIHIPSGCFPVQEYYLDDVITSVYASKESMKKDTYQSLISKPMKAMVKPDRSKLGVTLIERLHTTLKLSDSILVFLPGMIEIEDFMENLTEKYLGGNESPLCPYDIHILHSLIAEEEQDLALKPPKEGKRKVILSTNIAESSITVPDVTVVIDFCLSKGKFWNESWNSEVMGLGWISKDSAQQRKGRAGRVQPGSVYRMISKDEYALLDDTVMPEIQRKPLSSVVLQILMFTGAFEHIAKLSPNREPPSHILNNCLDPPSMTLLEQAYTELVAVGAIKLDGEKPVEDSWETIAKQYDLEESYVVTTVGRFFSLIPTDIKIAYLILLGYATGLLPECIILVAMISRSLPILSFTSLKLYTARALYLFSDSSESDLIAGLNAYKLFKMFDLERRAGRMTNFQFLNSMRQHMVSVKNSHVIDALVSQICQSIHKNYGIFVEHLTPTSSKTHKHEKEVSFDLSTPPNSEQATLLKGFIAALNYDKAVIGETKKAHSPSEITCVLKLRNQKLSLKNAVEKAQMVEVLNQLFYAFDGGVVKCKTITPAQDNITITYSVPIENQVLVPFSPRQVSDPLFPAKMLSKMTKGSAQQKKDQHAEITAEQIKETMITVGQDSENNFGIFNKLHRDFVKSHGLKIINVSVKGYEKKPSFLHAQKMQLKKVSTIISRESVVFPWLDLEKSKRIMVPGTITNKDMVTILDKNTVLPNIKGFYEMCMILFLPLMSPQNIAYQSVSKTQLQGVYPECANSEEIPSVYFISDKFSKLTEKEKSQILLSVSKKDLQDMYTISVDQNVHSMAASLVESIHLKVTEFLLNMPISIPEEQIYKDATELLVSSPNCIQEENCGYKKSVNTIFRTSKAVEDAETEDTEDDSILTQGQNILRSGHFVRISERILNILSKQCILHPDEPVDSVKMAKISKSTIQIQCSNDDQLKQAKFLLLKEVNNSHIVYSHPRQAFVCIDSSFAPISALLSHKVHFSQFADVSHRNREFFTINVIHTKNPKEIKIIDSKEFSAAAKALKTKVVSEQLTIGGFLLGPYAKSGRDAFAKRPDNIATPEKKYVKMSARFGKQMFYGSRTGAVKIDSKQKGITVNDLRKMKIGRENDLKTLFLDFVDYSHDDIKTLKKSFIEARGKHLHTGVLPTGPMQSLLDLTSAKFSYRKEFISMGIVDIINKKRFNIRWKLNRSLVFVNSQGIELIQCEVCSCRDSEEKLIYLDYIDPISINEKDNAETVKDKNESTLDIRFSKTVQQSDKQTMDHLPNYILEFASSLWFDENTNKIFYDTKLNNSENFVDLVEVNLQFGDTVIDEEGIRGKTPLAFLSIDIANYNLQETFEVDTLKIQVKNSTEISHPFIRKSITSMEVSDSKLKKQATEKLSKESVRLFMKTLLEWKNLANTISLKSLQ